MTGVLYRVTYQHRPEDGGGLWRMTYAAVDEVTANKVARAWCARDIIVEVKPLRRLTEQFKLEGL